MSKQVIVIRHEDCPPDDRVHSWLVSNVFEPVIRKPFAGELLGEPDDDIAGTVIHGGKYNVDETGRYPFLNEEYRWIDSCLKRHIPMLGICRGAQQIAYHLGARVGPLTADFMNSAITKSHLLSRVGRYFPILWSSAKAISTPLPSPTARSASAATTPFQTRLSDIATTFMASSSTPN